uniref:Uncharacterized protein n=1 Tax=Leersia perrieri TaxID=77586 RepID=A0A0D9X5J0_9ORYZ
MCSNYVHKREKSKPASKMKGKKGKGNKPIEEPEIPPPPLCDSMEWIGKEMSEFHTSMIVQWRKWDE